MKFYFDENFAPTIARALNVLETHSDDEVFNIIDVFDRGVPDEQWIPFVGKENGIIITQD